LFSPLLPPRTSPPWLGNCYEQDVPLTPFKN
jgi:hypothetical protein